MAPKRHNFYVRNLPFWLLGPSWRQEGPKSRKPIENTTSGPSPGGPSWDQMPPKPDPKTNQKNYHFLEALRNDFWWILGPKSRFPICSDRSHVGSWVHLGAKMAPRRPKKPQEAPKTASKTDFGAILVDFWLIF